MAVGMEMYGNGKMEPLYSMMRPDKDDSLHFLNMVSDSNEDD